MPEAEEAAETPPNGKLVLDLIAKTAAEKGVASYAAFLKIPEAADNPEFVPYKKFGELTPTLRYKALNILKKQQ
jgi:hypothetical protein